MSDNQRLGLLEFANRVAHIWKTHVQSFNVGRETMPVTTVELDVNIVDEIRTLIRPIVQRVADRYFDDSTDYANEMASSIEDELIDALHVDGRRVDKIREIVGGDAVYRAGQIKELLKDVPDDRMILSQVVGSKTGVYNAYVEMGILRYGDGPVVISAGHPELAHLPMCSASTERNQTIDRMIEDLNQLRNQEI